MNTIKIKYFSIILLISFSLKTFASQKFTVNDGDVIKVKISSRDLTRITVNGGRVEKIWGPAGILETQADKKGGEVFIRPGMSAGNALSFFVKDSFGSTYTLIGEQYDLPSQTIVLSPVNRSTKAEKENPKSSSVIKDIKNIIKALYQGDEQSNYEVVNVNKEVSLWKEVEVTHLKNLSGEKLIGEIYELKNKTSEEMRLSEEEFLNFRSDTLAVAIEKLNLSKNEITHFYIIRKR